MWGGVIYHVSRVPSKDAPTGYRTVLHVITPDGRDVVEYAEFFDGARLESCVVYDFPDSPFIMTMRRSPTLTDNPDDLEWVIVGSRAEYLAELKNELSAKSMIIGDLQWLLEQRNQSLEQLKRQVTMLEEKVREYEKELEVLSREKVDLETSLRRIITLVEKHMAGELEATAALRDILKKAELAGKYEVMGVKDRLEHILERDREIMDKIQTMYSGDGVVSDKKMSELVELLSKKIDEKIGELRAEIEKLKEGSNGAKKEEVKEEAGV